MASLCAYLSYPDAPAVVEWLTALGFGVVQRADDGDRVLHAELRRGDAVVMLASEQAGFVTGAHLDANGGYYLG